MAQRTHGLFAASARHVVTFGHLLKEPLYEFHTHVIPRLALLLLILLLPLEDDRFSIDYLLKRSKNKRVDAKN